MLGELIKTTARESSVYFTAQIIAAATGFITLPIFARIFVPAEYGLITLAMLVVSIGSIVFGNWLTSSVNRFFPYYKRIGKLDTFYSSLLFCMFIAFIGFYLLGTPLYFMFRGSISAEFRSLIPLVALLVPLTAGFEIFLTNFRIKQQANRYVTFQLSRTFLGLMVGLSLVIWFHFGVAGILWGHIIALFIFGIVMFKLLFLADNQNKLNSISLSTAREFATFGFPAMAATIGTWILTGADRYIIEYFQGTSEVGLYSMGYNIGNMIIGMLVSSLMLGIGPSVINVWESDNRELTGKLLSQLTRLLILITLPATIGISVLAEPIFKLLTTPAYYPGSVVVPFAASGAFIYGLSLLSYTGLGLAKRTDIVMRNYFLAALFNVLLNVVLVPKFGFIAAAVTTTLSYAVLLVLNIKSANKYLKWVVIPRSAFNATVASVVMGAIVFYIIRIFSNALLDCIFGVVIGAVTYLTMILLLNEFSHEEKSEIKKFVKERLRII